MRREVRVWAKMRHENILRLIGYFWNSGPDRFWKPAVVSPYIAQGNLSTYLQQEADIPLRLRLQLVGLCLLMLIRSAHKRVTFASPVSGYRKWSTLPPPNRSSNNSRRPKAGAQTLGLGTA